MGNRAVITTDSKLQEIGIYLHWNGGRDSVEGFLAFCKLRKYTPLPDSYGWSYLAGVCSIFMEDGLSCGIQVCSKLDCNNGDNGVYIVDKNWLITERLYCTSKYAEQQVYPLRDMVECINEHMPESMRLTEAQWARFPEVEAEIIAQRDKTVYIPCP